MKTLETERLTLRTFTLDDLNDLNEYGKNPNIGHNAGFPPHTNKDESLVILERFISGDDVWAIELKENGKVIGSIGLHNDALRVGVNCKMLGYVLSEDYWGNGLATEAARCMLQYAFIELDIDIVSVRHFSFNDKSRRVIEKCGFTYEGTLRQCFKRYDGEIFSDSCYSMLKSEYLELYK